MTRKTYTLDADYRCGACDARRVKLWRDYGYPTPLWCATCCDGELAKRGAKHHSPPGFEDPTDFDEIGMVPAVPSPEDPQFFRVAGSLSEEGLLWWHALPTYLDAAEELACLRAQVLLGLRVQWARERRNLELLKRLSERS